MKLFLRLLWLVSILMGCLCNSDFGSFQNPIRCMNFYGLETDHMGMVCDWVHDHNWYLDRLVRDMKINTIRLPFSYEYIKFHNTDLMGQVIKSCHDRGLKVILDWHRNWMSHQGPTPEEGISFEEFTTTWIEVLRKFPNVYGVGIFNEIQLTDFNYANEMHRSVIFAIEREFPNKYYYFAGCVRWGGDCQFMNLFNMPTWNRTFIEVHKYIFSGNSTPVDWDKSIPFTIPPERYFVGEVGWKNDIAEERLWAEKFLSYLSVRNINNLCAWTIAHSGDTEGWWKDDCDSFQYDKAALLLSFWSNSLKQVRRYSKQQQKDHSSYIKSDNRSLRLRHSLPLERDNVSYSHTDILDRVYK